MSPVVVDDPVAFIEGNESGGEDGEGGDEGGDEEVIVGGPRRTARISKPSQYVKRVMAGESIDGLPRGLHYHPYLKGTGSSAVLGFAKSALAKAAGIPRSLREAEESEEWPMWKEAMQAEIDKIKSNKTYDLVDRKLAKGETIPLQWVFDYKVDTEGNMIKYKARLVAQGDKQQHLVNFNQTASPVMRSTTQNLLLALAAKLGWHVCQGDFTSAYLNGILRPRDGEAVSPEQAKMPPIFTEQPPGFEETGMEDMVCLLYKAIYGLKQSG
jgi:hypothetical protein